MRSGSDCLFSDTNSPIKVGHRPCALKSSSEPASKVVQYARLIRIVVRSSSDCLVSDTNSLIKVGYRPCASESAAELASKVV